MAISAEKLDDIREFVAVMIEDFNLMRDDDGDDVDEQVYQDMLIVEEALAELAAWRECYPQFQVILKEPTQ